MSTKVRIYVGMISLLAVLAAVWVYTIDPSIPGALLRAAAVLSSISALCEALAFKKASRSESGSLAFVPILASVIVAPHWVTVVAVAIAICIVQLAHRRAVIKGLFNTAQFTLSSAVAILLYLQLGGASLLDRDVAVNWFAILAMLFVFVCLNSGAVAGVIAISERHGFWNLWWGRARVTVVYDLFTLPLVYVFAWCYINFGPLGAIAMVAPILFIRELYKVNWQLESTNQELLELMVAAIEARDPYTSGHSRRVARNSLLIARAIGLREKQVERVRIAALLHDVGKIHEVFAPILSKPGRLTADENAVMQTHPIKSEELVRMVSQLSDVVLPIRHHHENWDGTGYPDGLVAEKIPIASRIIMFADTIDAMTTDRPYRQALTETQVRGEFIRLKGRQFDPDICDKLLASPVYPKLFDQDVPLTPAIATQDKRKINSAPLLAG